MERKAPITERRQLYIIEVSNSMIIIKLKKTANDVGKILSSYWSKKQEFKYLKNKAMLFANAGTTSILSDAHNIGYGCE